MKEKTLRANVNHSNIVTQIVKNMQVKVYLKSNLPPFGLEKR